MHLISYSLLIVMNKPCENVFLVCCFFLEPSQSIKLKGEIGPASIDTLDQDHKLQRKEFCILWTENSTLSNISMFLSFYIVQKVNNGAAFQDFLWALLTKDQCCPRSISLTEEERTQDTPKRKKAHYHRIHVFA